MHPHERAFRCGPSRGLAGAFRSARTAAQDRRAAAAALRFWGLAAGVLIGTMTLGYCEHADHASGRTHRVPAWTAREEQAWLRTMEATRPQRMAAREAAKATSPATRPCEPPPAVVERPHCPQLPGRP